MSEKRMTVEWLYPEVCNCFGDPYNAQYLKLSVPDAVFYKTPLSDEPFFASGEPDLILIGSMSERTQRAVLERLRPYAGRLSELADAGKMIIATGNASDLFGRKIDYLTEKTSAEGLGLFDFSVVTDWFRRVNAKTIGDFEGITVTGFRSQFSRHIGDNSGCAFLSVERGLGLDENSKFEGWRRGGLIATQLLGPLLVLNPPLCRYIIEKCGADASPAYEEAAARAYEKRVAEFRDPSTDFSVK